MEIFLESLLNFASFFEGDRVNLPNRFAIFTQISWNVLSKKLVQLLF